MSFTILGMAYSGTFIYGSNIKHTSGANSGDDQPKFLHGAEHQRVNQNCPLLRTAIDANEPVNHQ